MPAIYFAVSIFSRWRSLPLALEIMLDNALQPFCEREFPELMKVKP